MPTQEERLIALEQLMSEFKPVLQDYSYESTMVKGLIVTQTSITQELRRDVNEVKKKLDGQSRDIRRLEIMLNDHTETLSDHTTRLGRIETALAQHSVLLTQQKELLTQILERLPEQL
jgi:septal ring factor EnvC (AmiA/AmiB activator)